MQRQDHQRLQGDNASFEGGFEQHNAVRPEASNAQQSRAVQQQLLADFSKALDTETRQATFTCGGTLPILLSPNRDDSGKLTPRTDEKVQDQRVLTKPVTLRWGPDGRGRKVTLPITNSNNQDALQQLIWDCTPATFGHGGEDVYDETYRRAGAMGDNDFMTDFCPYETGIIDVVTQLLLPSITGDLEPPAKQPKPQTKQTQYHIPDTQEQDIVNAISMMGRQMDNFLTAKQTLQFLENWQVPPVDSNEIPKIMEALDMEETGQISREDLIDFTVLRVKWKRARYGVLEHTEILKPIEPKIKRRTMMSRGIRAELHKLNVYSGPSGLFKPHIDTPRSGTQLGSLVVCLPVAFQGGKLAV